jgi:hypothetical protein
MVSSAIPVATIAIWDVTIEVGNVTETHEHAGEFKDWVKSSGGYPHSQKNSRPSTPSALLCQGLANPQKRRLG